MPAYDFKLVFDQPERIYFPGQWLRGKVHLTFREPKALNALRLEVSGRADVHWSTGSGEDREDYYGHEVYLDVKHDLYRAAGATVPAGESVYPFEVLLPPTLPTSFESPVGKIRYHATVVLDRPWKMNQSVKENFTIATVLDLNREPGQLTEPHEMARDEVTTSYCCCACCARTDRGGVDARVTINKRCFVPGESILVNGRVTNNTSSTLPLVRAALRKTVTYRVKASPTASKTSSSSYMVACEHPNIRGGDTDNWNNVSLMVPALPPSRHDGCGIIDIDYAFEFWVKVGSLTRLQLEAPVIIGTVALGGVFYPPPPGAAVVTTQPPGPTPFIVTNAPPNSFGFAKPPDPFSAATAPPSYQTVMAKS